MDEENLDEMVAKRVHEEEELTDQQAQRMAQVHEAAQYYTEEDWYNNRAKLEANIELVKDVLGEDMWCSQINIRIIVLIPIKALGSWLKLKKLTFEELKTEFEKLVKSIESFVPMGFKERVKRHEEKGDEPMKKIGKRKKQIARKGIHTDKTAKDEAEEDMEAIEKGDSSSGTDILVNHVLIDIKPPSITNWKIIKLGKKGVYQIVRKNGTDKIYISFEAMLKDISTDDLTELYRLVMQRYGTNGSKDKYER
ncbi:hypothetical protein Tco_1180879, partial [Tanacetum coccineum]